MARAEIHTSPKGTAKFPHLTVPDTKFDATGTYHVKLVLPPEEGEKFAEKVEAAHKESVSEYLAKNPKLKKVKENSLPYAIDDETGNYEFKFKLNAQGISQGKTFTNTLSLYDAKRNPLPKDVKIGGGSTLKIAFEFNKYFAAAGGAGVSLRMKAVQVLELRSFTQRSAADLGFDEEDGYTASDDAAAFEETEETQQDDNGGDF